MRKYLLLLLFTFCFAIHSHATHIVGGSLTYTYNGGTSYTITLKLYRDCRTTTPATAAMPNSATILIRRPDGSAFSPSLDVLINRTSISTLAPIIDTCVTKPNVCVQEGIFTKTVNLPAGSPYHLYYQIGNRNSTITNIVNPSTRGASYSAYIPGSLWFEDFTFSDGITSDTGTTKWSVTNTNASSNYAEVRSNRFQTSGALSQVVWTSDVINISGYPGGVDLSADLAETSTLNNNDTIKISYKLDGGSEIQFPTNGRLVNDFTSAIAKATGLVGNTVQIIARFKNDASSKIYRLDNVMVAQATSFSNSTPEFTNFPPIFVCQGKSLVFDYSASDADDDSLVYSLYTPYDGPNDGSLPPTFSGGNISFTPITWASGFGATNALGGSAGTLNLNSSTGILTTTPQYIGQYVVGVKVKEYRGGKFIEEIVRDFQFNVVDCPPPAQAHINNDQDIKVCSGSALTFNNTSDAAAVKFYWDFGVASITTDTSYKKSPTYTYPALGTYTARLITGYGTACADTTYQNVVISYVTPTFTHNAPKCVGSNVTFTNTSTPAPSTTISSTKWYFGDGTTSTTTNATHSYSSSGTFTVKMVVSNSLGCKDSISQNITINPLPVATASSNTPVCAGSNLNLNGNTIASASYSWTGPNSFTSNIEDPTISTATAAAAGTYTLTITEPVNGCTSIAATTVVAMKTTPAALTLGSNTPVCATQSLNLSANTVASGVYSWTGPNSFSSSTEDPIINPVTAAAAGTYSATVTVNGCTSLPSTTSVVVNATPAALTLGSNTPVCATQSLNLSANTVASGIYSWTGPNSYSSSAEDPTINPVTAAAAGTYSATVTVNGCTSLPSTTSVVVNATPAALTLGSNTPVCATQSLNLSANTVASGVYSWTGPNSFSSSTEDPIINPVTAAAAGTYSATVTVNGCTSLPATTTVVVNATPAALTLGTNTPVCATQSLNLSANIVASGVYSWTGPNSFVSSAEDPIINPVTAAAAGTYSATVTVNGCTSLPATTTVVVNATPAALTLGSNTPVCATQSLSLSANTVASGVYSWTGPNSFVSSAEDPIINPVTAAAAGTYSATVTVNGCTSLAATTTVVVTPTPVALTLGSNTPVCATQSLNLSANTVASGVYSWTGPNSFSSSSEDPIINPVTAAAAGTYSATVTVNGCTSLPATTTVVVNATPAALTLGSNTPVCATQSLNLSANTVASGVYSWTGPNSFSSSTEDPIINPVTAAAAGTYSATVTVNGCTSLPATTSVVVNATPVALTLGSNTPVCATQSLNLSANTVASGVYSWTGPNSFVSSAEDPIINPVTAAAAGTYSATVTVNGCTSLPATTTVVVNATPAALTLGSNTPVCATQSLNLSANTVASGVYSWTGPNSFVSSAEDPIINPVTAAAAGTYSATVTVNGCTSLPATTTVVVNATPAALTLGSNTPVCATQSLNLSANTVASGVYSWTGPNSFSSSIEDPIINPVTAAAAGTYSATVTVNGCTSLPATTTVVVNATPAALTLGSNTPVCATQSLNLSANTVASGVYSWTGPNSFVSSAEDPIINPVTAAAAGTYSATVTVNGCTSLAATTTVVVTPTPVALTLGSNTPVCATQSLNLSANTVASGVYSWTGPNSFSSSSEDPIINPVTAAAAGTYSATVTVNGCTSLPATTTVVVNATPAALTLGSNTPVCATQSLNLSANTVASGVYSWTGPNSFSSSTEDPIINPVTAAAAGTYSATVTVNGCTSLPATTTVVVNATPAALTLGSNTPVCATQSLNLSANTVASGVYLWTGPNSFVSSAEDPIINPVTAAAAGTYSATVTVNGCTSLPATTTVVVNATPAALTLGSNTPVCATQSLNLSANTVASGVYSWTGPNSFVSSAEDPIINPVTAAAAGTYSATVTVNGCTSLPATTTVVVNATPAALTLGSNTPVCATQSLNLSANTVASGVYSWTGPNSFVSSAEDPIINPVTAAAAGTYSATVTVNGCTSLPATTTVIVNAIPAAPTASNNGPLCYGTTLNLSANNIAGASYSWTGPNGYSSALQNPSISPVGAAEAGTYSVKVTVAGCQGPAGTTTAVISPIPAAPTASNNGPLCYGTTLNLSANNIAGASYAWTGPNGYSSTLQNPSISPVGAVEAGTYSVKVTVSGCQGPAGTTTAVISPIPAAPTASNNGPLCYGTTLNLSANNIAGASYAWTGPNGYSSALQNPSISPVGAVEAGTYSVKVTVSGCQGPAGTTTAVISPIPAAPTASNNGPLCYGTTLNLSANNIAGASYSWTGPNGYSSALQNPSISPVGAAEAGTYSVKVTVAGCQGPAGTTTAVISPIPAAPTASNNGPLCYGTTLNLSANNIAGASYAWTGPNGYSSTLQNPSISPVGAVEAGTYSVKVTVAGCQGPAGTTTAVISPIPAAPTASNNGPLCYGTTLNLSANNIAGASYAWTGPNGYSSTLQNPSISPVGAVEAGTYSVKVTVSGCQGPAGTTTAVISPIPAAPTASNNGPLCYGTTLNLSANNIAGASYSWTGPNGYSSALQNPSISPVGAAEAGTYSVKVTVAGCQGPAGTTTAVISPIPAAPTASNNGPLCYGTTLNLSANNIAGASYAWTGPNGFSSAIQNPSISPVGAAEAGTYSVKVTVGGCQSPAGTTTAVISPIPAAPTASNNGPLCYGTTLNLSANNIAGASYSWTGPNGYSSTIQNPSISPVGAAEAGTYSVKVTVAGCQGPAGTTNVITSPIPAAPTVSNNGPLCYGTTLNLSANNIAGASYSWTGPNGYSSALQNPSISPVGAAESGTYSVKVTVGGCQGPAGTTNVITSPIPATPTASNDGPKCAGTTLNLSANNIAGASYAWTGPAGFTSSLQNPSVANVAIANAGTYSVKVTVGGCQGAAGNTVVTVNPIPSAPTATNNGPLCVGNTLNLSANNIVGASYTWSGPNGFTSAIQNPSLANVSLADAGTFSVTATVAGCTGPAGTTNVTINPIPAAPILGSNSPACQTYTLNLNSNLVAAATYNWTGPNGFSSALQNPSISNVSLAAGGTYSATVTVAGCQSPAGTTNVVIKSTPIAPASSNNGPLCAGTSLNLTAANIAGASYAWTGPNGFISNSQNPTVNIVTLADAGAYLVTATVGGCTGPASTTNVVINPIPSTPSVGNNGPLCVGATLNLTAANIAGAAYSWTGPNGFTSAIQNPSQSNVVLADAGTYSVTATVSGCTSIAGTTNVSINTIPAAPIVGSDSPVCETYTLNLSANTIAGASYSWTGPNGFTSSVQNPSITSVTAAAAGIYSAQISVAGCQGPAGTTTVVIKSTPVAPSASNNGPLCVGATLNLAAGNIASAVYSWTGPNGFNSSAQNPIVNNVSVADSGIYSVTATVGGCTGPAGTTNVVINTIPLAPTLGSNTPVCVGQTLNLTANTVSSASYNWSGPAGFSSAVQNPNIPAMTLAKAGTYSATVTVAGCTGPAGTTDVVVNPIPASPVASNDGPHCADLTLNLFASNIAGATYNWTGPNGFISTDQNPSINNIPVTGSGTYSVTSTVLGCTSPAATTSALIKPIPPALVLSSNSPICETFTLNLNANTIAGTYSWTGPNGFVSALEDPSIPNISLAAQGTYSSTVTVNGCTSPISTLNVAVLPINVPPVASNNGPLCVGQTLNLSTDTVVGASYNWTGPAGFNSTLQNPTLPVMTVAKAGTYSVSVTVNGCTSPAGSTTVTVNTIPSVPTASNDGPHCEGIDLNLAASNVAGATYSWTGPNGFTSATQNPLIASAVPADSGLYSVRAIVNGCASAAATTNAVINKIPSAPILGSNSPVCETSTLNLTAVNVALGNFSWTGPNGFTSTFQNPTIPNVSLAAAGTYSSVVTVNGCTSPTGTVAVTVYPIGVPPAVSSNGPLCSGDTLKLNGATVPGAIYSWTGPNGFTSNIEDPIILNSPAAASGSYSLTVSVNGCTSPAGTTNVLVKPTPSALSLSSNSPICETFTLNFSANTIAGTYSWTGPNGFVSAAEDPSIPNVSLAAAGTYSSTVTVNGCTSPVSTVAVAVLPINTPPAVSNNGPLCVGQNLTLTTDTVVGANYNWTGPGGYTSNSQNPTIPNVTLAKAGNYSVTVTVNGCTSPAGTTSVVVNPIPSTPVASSNGPLCVGANLNLAASNIASTSYSWTGPNGFTAAVQNPGITGVALTDAGVYSVTATAFGCTSPAGSVNVPINPIPVAPNLVNNGPLCAGQTLNLDGETIAGATYAWTGPAAFASAIEDPSISNITLAKAGTYSATVTVSGCTGPAGTTDVIVNPIPATPTVANNGPLCVGQTLNLDGETIAGADYSWTGPNGFTSNIEDPAIANVTTSNAGNYLLTVTMNGCSSVAGSTSVIINTIPVAPAVSNNGPLCVGANLILSANTIAGATYSWTGPNGFLSALEDPTINNVALANGGLYSLTVTVNGCTGSSATTNLAVNPIPAAPIIASNTPVCETFSLNLTSNNVAGGTYSWTGPNSFTSTQEDPGISNVTMAAAGNYSVTVTVAGCTSPAANTNVVIKTTPVLTPSSNTPLCVGQTLNLNSNTITGTTYSWTGPNGFVSSAEDTLVSNVTVADAGTYSVTGTLNGCTGLTYNTNVVVNPIPAAPVLSNNGPLCAGTTLDLKSNTIAGATYSWSGPSGFSSALQNPIIGNIPVTKAGTYSAFVTVLGCMSPPSTTNVIVNPIPSTPTASNNGPLCVGQTLNLDGETIAGAIYNWTGPNGFTSNVEDPIVTNVTASDAGTYSLSVTVNGCTSLSRNTSVIINSIPSTPVASNNGPLCVGTTLNLSTTLVAGANYLWTGPNGFTSTVQNPVVNPVSLADAGLFSVTTTVNGCSSASGTTNVTVNPIPAAPVVSSNTPVCETQTLNLDGETITGSTYSWTGPNGFTSSVEDPSISNVTAAAAGTYSAKVTVSGCASTASTTNVVIKTTPILTASSNTPLCVGQTLNLNSNTIAGATYSWTGPNGYTSTQEDPTVPGVALTDGGAYIVTGTLNGCTGPSSTTNVTVNPIPAAPVLSNNGPLCEGTTLNLSANTIAGATYSWTGPAAFTSALEDPTVASITLAKAGTYSSTVTVLGCTSPAGTTDVIVNPVPAVPVVANNGPLCVGQTLNLDGETIASATYSWTGPNGFTSSLEDPSINNATAAEAGTYSLKVTVNGCTSSAGTTNVIVNPIPAAPVLSSNTPACETQSLNLFSNIIVGADYSWTGPNGFTSAVQNPIISNATTAAAGSYTATVTVSGCTSVSASTNVTVNPIPAAPVISSNTPVCETQVLNLDGETIAGATYSWTGPNVFTASIEDPSINNVSAAAGGTYSATVTVNGCMSAASTTNVVIKTTPILTASSNSPLCEGGTLNLNSNTVAGATYSWTGPNGFTSALEDPTISGVALTDAGAYTVTGTLNGCIGTSSTTNVAINPIPASPILSNNGPLCEGTTLNLNANTIAGATYSWTGPAGFTSSLEDPTVANITLAKAGTYSSTVTVLGCVSPAATTDVIVNPVPAAPLVANNGPLCPGQTLNLDGETIASAVYNWTGPNGFTSALEDPSISNVSAVNAGTYSLIVTVNACTSSSSNTSVVINSIPVVTAGGNTPICTGQTLNLTATTLSGATYNWTGPNGFTSALQNPVISNVSVAEAGSYGVTVTVSGCSSTATSNVNIVVNSTPAALTLSSNTPVCETAILNLSANTIAGGTYTWSGPNGFTSNVEDPSINNVPAAAAGTYTASVKVNGCTSQASTTDVIINPTPVLSASGNTPLCENQTLNLNSNTVVGATYSWTGPNGFTSSLEDPIVPNITLADAGNYSVTASLNGCTGLSSTTAVTINPVPASPILGNNTPICENAILNLTSNTVAGATYNWTGPNGFTSTLEDPSIAVATVANAGTYSATVTVNGCASPSGTTDVVVNPAPSLPTVSNNGPLCETQTLNLSANTVPSATYSWTGPNGFTSSLEDPIINNVILDDSGSYVVTITANGCSSLPAATNVIIRSTPAITAASNSPVCEGSNLNLSSNNFAGGNYVWTGPNGFTSNSQNPVISNVSNAAAGAYSVTVTVSGCTSTGSSSTTVVVNPIPAAPLAANNGAICEGQTLNLDGQTIAGATYSWTGPNGFTSTLEDPSIANTTLANAGTYNLKVTVNSCTSAAGSTTAVIKPNPVLTASSNTPLCIGQTLNLNSNTIAGATYTWTGPNGFTSTAEDTTVTNIALTDAGAYTVTGTLNGCTGPSSTTNVTVNPIPAAPVLANNGPLCEGTTLNLSANTIAGASYSWTGPAAFTSALEDPTVASITLAKAGTYSSTVTVLGCTSPAGTTDVIVNPVPAAPVVANNGPLCVGQTLNLDGETNASATYSWTGPNGFTSSLEDPSINNATAAEAGTYSLKVTVNGCTSSAGTTNVIVNPIPAAPVLSSNTPACETQSLNLFSNIIVGADYSWTGPNGFTSAIQNPTISNVTTAAAGSYTATVTVNGCTSVSASTNVTVNPIPAAPVISSNTPVCETQVLNLDGETIAGATYSWTGPNGFTASIEDPSINNVSAAAAGTYSATVTVNGCASAASTTNVVIKTTPVLAASSNSPLCEGGTLNLNSNTVAGATYSWTGPNGFTSTSEDPTLTNLALTDAGVYTVTGTLNGCTGTSSTTNVTVNPIPASPILSNNGPLCEGTTLNLNANTIAGATYSWTGPAGFTSSLEDPTVANVPEADSGTFSAVVTLNGCSSLPSTTEVIINAAPATPVGSNNGPLCPSQDLNLQANTVSGATYSWTGPNGFTSNLEDPTISNVSISNNGTYSLVITVNSCSSPTATTDVIINSTPQVTATNNGPLCNGQTLNLDANTLTGATYSWTGPNGFTSSLEDPSINNVSPSVAGNYSVTVTVNGCSSTATASTSVVVNSIPAAPVVSNNGPLCEFADLNLNANTIVGATYNWTGPNGFTSSLEDPIVNGARIADGGTYSLTATVNGCASAAGTTDVVINPAPVLTASGNSPLCNGQTLNLNTNTVPGAAYSWTGPNGFTSTLVNPTITNVSAIHAGTYSVKANLNGCTGPVSNVNVVVNAIPAAPVASSNSPVCEGSVLNLNSNTTPGTSYAWTGPNGFISSAEDTLITNVTLAAAGTYSVTATVNGCTSPVATTDVTIKSTPHITAASNGPLCPGAALNLNANTVAGATYSWTGPNGFTSTLEDPSISNVTLSDSGTYSVSASLNGCTSTISSTLVIIRTSPAIIIGSNSPACEGASLNLTSNPIQGATYSWTGPNGFTSSLEDPTISGISQTDSGTYSVTVTVNGCASPSTSNVKVAVNTIPTAPVLSNNSPLCEGADLNLTANTIAGATYSWTGPNGFTSFAQDTSMINVAARDSGTYSATVTVNGCTSPKANTEVKITSVPKPKVTSNTPLCEGATLNLNSELITGATYSWTGPNGFVSANQNPSVNNISINGAGTYSLVALANGCTGPIINTIVTVNPIPAAPTAASNGPICAGTDLKLNANTIAGASYNWTGPNGFISSAEDTTITNVTIAASGPYSLTVTVNGCTSPASTTNAVVNPIPATPVLSGNGPLCLGQTLNLKTDTITGATYNWTGPNGFTSTIQNPTRSNVTKADSGTYSVTVTVNSCTSLAGNTKVIINAKPVIKNISSNSPVCSGNALTLNVDSSQGASYKWIGPGAFTSTDKSPSINNIKLSDAGSYSVTVNVPGCPDTSASIIVKVNITPSADFSAVYNIDLDSAFFTDASTISQGNIVSWNWNFADGGTTTIKNPSHYFNVSGNYSVILTAKSDAGCIDTVSKVIDVKRKGFVIDFAAQGHCENTSIAFTDSSKATGSTITSWKWNFGDGQISTSQNPDHTYTQAGTYAVQLTITNSLNIQDSISKDITIDAVPQADFSDIADVIDVKKVTFNSTSTGAISYLWDFGDKAHSAAKDTIHNYKDIGIYKVKLIVLNSKGCADSISKEVNVTYGPVSVPAAFTPNGDGHNDVLLVRGDLLKDFEFSVYNEWGNLLFSSSDQSIGWDGTFNGKEQPSGVYVFTLSGTTKEKKYIKLSGPVTIIRY